MNSDLDLPSNRTCLRDPIPEIDAAKLLLNDAVSAHLAGRREEAKELIALADMDSIREWGNSLWGKKSPYVMFRPVQGSPPEVPKERREGNRSPTPEIRRRLIARDGYHCLFCGIPVIRAEIRNRIRKSYPELKLWSGESIQLQHAAFQTMWLQYDHLVPHSRGGKSDEENMVISCAPCNFGRMQYTLAEVGVADPRKRNPVRSDWDGLERFR
jgi:5-methylcytosine-specific restriction endonuclease McrA